MAVNSLMRTMESVLHSKSPMQSLICDYKEEFLALREKVRSLEVFLKSFEEHNYSGKLTELEAPIKEAADVVEHVIQLRLTESLMANDEMQKKEAHERLCNSLQLVAEEIDYVYKESTKFQDKGKQASKILLDQYSSSEKNISNVNKNNMVGRDDEREKLLEDLTRCYSGELEVISIVGMGGIGKTTLAKEIYSDASIQSHFDIFAWATISQHHNVKEILLSLLHTIKGDTFQKEDESELADMLRKSLMGKRYLVVMDDMWSSQAWDDLRQCFPSQNNASRILLTTRNTDVARYAGTDDLSLQMGFMDSDDSWNIFKIAAFANKTLPAELESIGKQIVDKCQGLPLTIVVVAGLLSKSKRNTEVWETIAENVTSFVTNDPDKHCLQVLGLSYNHLYGNLKACLLYFGIFPEDSEISVKRLVRLWMAEGFLKLEKDMEVEGEKCLQDLIDRCLVLVSKKSRDGKKIKSCKVHDLIYEMCLRNSQSQNFFIINDIVFDSYGERAQVHDIVYDNEPNLVHPEYHRLSSHKMGSLYDISESYRTIVTPRHHHLIKGETDDGDDNLLRRIRSIMSFCEYPTSIPLLSELTHLNVLRILELKSYPMELNCFPPEILSLIWLRYLALYISWEGIPPEICRLCNLQTLIVKNCDHPTTFTEQIWDVMHLSFLQFGNHFYFPSPSSVSVEGERYLGFSEIHTIQGLSPSSCTKKVISGIRNVKKLGIYGKEDDYESFQEYGLFNNLVHLHQLETLSIRLFEEYSGSKISPVIIPSAMVFPATLKKLKLMGTYLRWEDMNVIGELPNLELLKLLYNACKGEEWRPRAGGFTRLKLLLIRNVSLKYWKATDDNFPVLECLFIEGCFSLEEIPTEFADILSLQLIQLSAAHPKLKAYVRQIQQEQQEIGNEPVHVCFNGDVIIPGDDDNDSDDIGGGNGDDDEEVEKEEEDDDGYYEDL